MKTIEEKNFDWTFDDSKCKQQIARLNKNYDKFQGLNYLLPSKN